MPELVGDGNAFGESQVSRPAPVAHRWWVKIRRWSPVVVGSGAAGSFLVFVVVVPGKDLGALSL
jgi:hypothetical protein